MLYSTFIYYLIFDRHRSCPKLSIKILCKNYGTLKPVLVATFIEQTASFEKYYNIKLTVYTTFACHTLASKNVGTKIV